MKSEINGQEEQYKNMTENPVKPLIVSLAIPTIISMMITAIYNMADTYFVSKLGTSASAAIGIVFSLMALIQAGGFAIGMGSGSIISRLLGEQKNEEADEVASSGLFAGISLGILLLVFGIVFITPLMKMLGATHTILPFAKEYAKYILISAPIMMGSFVLNNLLRCQGKAKLSMIGIATGAVVNIILDPIFIFVFKLGISGAAIATAFSQFISFIILLSLSMGNKSILKLSIKHISKRWEIYSRIIRTGMPSFCRQGLASLATVALNVNAVVYGDSAVAAMTIVTKVFMMVFSIVIGFGQGYQPVVGYNYGAKNMKRVKEAMFFTLSFGSSIMTIFAIIGVIFAPNIIKSFIDTDPQVVQIGVTAFRYQCIAMPFMPVGVLCNMTFQSIGKTREATFLSACRQGVYFLPFIVILPRLFGLSGVEITQPIADLCTCLTCIPFLLKFLKNEIL